MKAPGRLINQIGSYLFIYTKFCTLPGNPSFVKHFEHFLIALAEKSNNAGQLLNLLDQSSIDRQALSELVLLINKKSGNNAEWLQSAQQFYHGNTIVAKQLLEYYFEKDKDSFIKTAKELFAENKYQWIDFLRKFVTPSLDRELFVCIYRQLVIKNSDIDCYKKVREYLTERDIEKILAELRWNSVFVARVLEVENRYEDIKALVENNSNNWNYAEMITPILSVYPEFCFSHIKNKAMISVQNERGRHHYVRLVSWLVLALKIPGFEKDAQDLIREVYGYKPNLPALQAEMRKAGIIKL